MDEKELLNIDDKIDSIIENVMDKRMRNLNDTIVDIMNCTVDKLREGGIEIPDGNILVTRFVVELIYQKIVKEIVRVQL